MKYWVKKTELKYDTIGNERGGSPKSEGLYRCWLCEIEPKEELKDELESIWLSHNEYFDRETDSWECAAWGPSEYEIDPPEDLYDYKEVTEEECSDSAIFGYVPKNGKEKWQFDKKDKHRKIKEEEPEMKKDKLRENFEKFFDMQMQSTEEHSLKELFFLFYQQGHLDNTPVGEEISVEEVEKTLENQAFIDFIQSCISNPDEVKASAVSPCDYVDVVYECSAEDKKKCIAWPDRCEECGGDGEKCHTLINLSKLCGVEENKAIFIRDKDKMTTEEAAQLSAALTDFIRGNE